MRTGIVSLVLFISLLGFTPASAGGGNWIELDDTYNVPGSEMRVAATFYRNAIKKTRAEAPYYLYLERIERPQYGLFLPDVGDPNVHRVGVMDIEWPAPSLKGKRGFGYEPRLTGVFEVPALEPGEYQMAICNLECDHAPGGRANITPTSGFWIVRTPGEAETRAKLDAIEHRFLTFRYRDQRQDRKAYREYTNDLKEIASDRDEAEADVISARVRERDVRDALVSTRFQRDWAFAGLAVFGVMGLCLATRGVVRSRRRARSLGRGDSPVPDSGSPSPAATSVSPSISRRWRRV